jgi:3-hydroxyisobutyrate dehydrogenase-like beta-hydroxyacid dehydrogenase
MTSKPAVAFLGTGRMSQPMATDLVRAGFLLADGAAAEAVMFGDAEHANNDLAAVYAGAGTP